MFNMQDFSNYSNQPVYFGQEPAFSSTKRTGRRPSTGNPGTASRTNWYKKDEQDPKIVALQQQQQAAQQKLQATAARSQLDIAKQLKIVQNERSAVSKLSRDYSDMLQKEAEAKAKAMEDAKIAAATSAANQSRQGQTSNLQIQPASQTAKISGTKVFKKRGLNQFMSGISGMVNI